jgi:hypothetical protein
MKFALKAETASLVGELPPGKAQAFEGHIALCGEIVHSKHLGHAPTTELFEKHVAPAKGGGRIRCCS